MTNSRRSQKGMSRASIAVAAFSTVVEWYDFTLYLLPRHRCFHGYFFGGGGTGLTTTLAAFAIAYLLRPLGGIMFWPYRGSVWAAHNDAHVCSTHDNDDARHRLAADPCPGGRCGPLASFLLRCVMGFSVGGEYIAVVAYLLEGAPRNRRGLITSLASASVRSGGSSRSPSPC